MRDYIDREDAIKVVSHVAMEFIDRKTRIELINAIPSADLNAEFAEWAKLWFKKELEAGRPQGEWIIHSNGKMCDCSACNESYDRTFEYVDEWNYCPNCGAKMK